MPRTAARRYIVIKHCDEARALLVPGNEGWSLPFVTLDKHLYSYPGPLTKAIRSETGIQVSVLRCLYRHPVVADADFADRVFEVEAQGTDWQPPVNGRWFDRAAIAGLELAIPEHQGVLQAWFDEVGAPEPHQERAPWTLPGWLAHATTWIDQQLQTNDLRRIGPVAPTRGMPTSRVRPRCSRLRSPLRLP